MTMTIIEARHYGDARRVLRNDPIVKDMARGLVDVPLDALTHEDGSPRFEFMQRANREYAKRGGTNQAHIGGVAEALLMILNSFDNKTKEGKTMNKTATKITKTTKTSTAKTTKPATKPATKTSRYNAAYAKAYRDAKRYPVLITLDF